MQDVEPNDIWVDSKGKLWRIVEVVREPRVTVEEVEGKLYDPNAPSTLCPSGGGVAGSVSYTNFGLAVEIRKNRLSGMIGDAMWDGWKRIYRRSAEK